MSTRCHVIITKGNDKSYVYRHHDGYPDGAGEDLKNFINSNKDNFNNWSVNDFSIKLENEMDDFEFENYGIHGDEEYIYFIDMDNIILECYEYTWDLPENEIKTKMILEFKESFKNTEDIKNVISENDILLKIYLWLSDRLFTHETLKCEYEGKEYQIMGINAYGELYVNGENFTLPISEVKFNNEDSIIDKTDKLTYELLEILKKESPSYKSENLINKFINIFRNI